MKFIFVSLIILSSQSMAQTFEKVVCPFDNAKTAEQMQAADQKLAEEFVQAELAGWRLPGNPSVCLDQKQFEYFPVNNYGLNDAGTVKINYVNKDTPITVQVSRTELNGTPFSDPGDRRADFFRKTAKGREKLGSLFFTLYPKPAAGSMSQWRKEFGCAAVYSYPDKMYVWDHCKARQP